MKLPQEFLDRMQLLLGDEFQAFLKSYDDPRYYGLRVNTLKVSIEDFIKISPFTLEPVPWAKDGFHYKEGESPGRHPYYHAGLYYIQEPSAMLPGAIIEAKPGERILDLCAAPGGKTVQMAAAMQGQGLLLANDINSERVKALVKNIELNGIKNAIVTNDTPEKLTQRFKGYFDKILVDAPCSGEGMFRKDEEAAKSWENFKCERCARMQRDILSQVDEMLKEGGRLLYSTCTFAPEEDEKMIAEFLSTHPEYIMLEIPHVGGIDRGRAEWADGNPELNKAVRLWPHKLKGEGHFVALLQKGSIVPEKHSTQTPDMKIDQKFLDVFKRFSDESLQINLEGYYHVKGSNLYHLPVELPDISGIKVAKFGWYLGEVIKDRFEPSHSLVTALHKDEVKNVLDMPSGSEEIQRYLKGETLLLEGKKGYTAVCVDGFTLGWAKQTGDILKNLYPKGWRRMS